MEIIQPVLQPRYVQMVIFCRIGPTSVGRPTPVTKAAVTAIVLLLWVVQSSMQCNSQKQMDPARQLDSWT